eukprot:150629_1
MAAVLPESYVANNSREKDLLSKIKEFSKQLEEVRAQSNDSIQKQEVERERLDGTSLIIVTNRLPLSLKFDESTGEWKTKMSSGGLVSRLVPLLHSALSGVSRQKMKWVGWVGTFVPEEDRPGVIKQMAEHSCIPVFIPEDIAHQYYNGFANDILWPLFHYVPIPIKTVFDASDNWYAYQEANRMFAKMVLDNSDPGDVIWVHDYHLMLLPKMLRRVRRRCKLGWFLHTPFPSSEIFRTVPYRESLLKGLLSCNLIGFHTFDYARHFKSSCTRILGYDATPEAIEHRGHLTTVGAFPIGINYSRFADALKLDETKRHIEFFRKQFAGQKVIVGIDRLDYVKGLLQKFYAYEKFLEDHPEWVSKVVLVQIAVPSRGNVQEYQKLAEDVHELVGRINGRFGQISNVPIHYLDQSIGFNEMVALYHIADCALITSVRDGMNLVSYEYVASQPMENAGVLILSEFVGAAQSLGAGCIRVNPWNISETASAIRYALAMSEEERMRLHSYALQYVKGHTAQDWADDFVRELLRSYDTDLMLSNKPLVPPALDMPKMLDDFVKSKRRLLFLGLLGTITGAREKGMPFDQFLEFTKCTSSNAESLLKLTLDPNTIVVVMTSRMREFADKVLGDLGSYVSAENGFFVRKGGSSRDWMLTTDTVDLSWMEEVERVMSYFVERTPRSFMEHHETFVSWHYRDCDEEFSANQARDLVTHLQSGPLVNCATEVIHFHETKSVQVRMVGFNKSLVVTRLLQEMRSNNEPEPDFVLCIGNYLLSDEDLFSSLENEAKPQRSGSYSSLRGANDKSNIGKKNSLSKSARGSFTAMRSSELVRSSSYQSLRSQAIRNGSTEDVEDGDLVEDTLNLDSLYPNLPSSTKVYTITVGKKPSLARAYIRDNKEIEGLLRSLSNSLPESNSPTFRSGQAQTFRRKSGRNNSITKFDAKIAEKTTNIGDSEKIIMELLPEEPGEVLPEATEDTERVL